MHYVRFLKQPTLRHIPSPSSKKRGSDGTQKTSLSICALITLETDLGDGIYYADIALTCSIVQETSEFGPKTPWPRNATSTEVKWNSGVRSVSVELPLKGITLKELAAAALRLRISTSQPGGEEEWSNVGLYGGRLVMPVVIPQISALIKVDGNVASGRVQVARPLDLGHGRELMIWEDAGVSMARHVW